MWRPINVLAVLFLTLTSACGPVTASAQDGLSAEVERETVSGEVGATVDFDLTISNRGRRSADVRLSALGSWIDINSGSEFSMESGDNEAVHLHLHCGDGPMVRHSWLIAEASRYPAVVVPVRLVCGAEDGAEPDSDLLFWEPPLLEDATLIRVSARPSSTAINLERDRDYLLLFPDEPVTKGLGIVGGRNVVIMGGEISIPHQDEPTIASRRGLILRDSTGTVHIEGLHLGGEDISEGIQISNPQAIVQLQNISIIGLHARDQEDFSDNHPDVVQPYGNVEELRIDRLTATTDYQGLFLSAPEGHGPAIVRRTNIKGDPTARYLFWVRPDDDAGAVELHDVWLDVPDERRGGIGRAVWPDVSSNRSRRPSIETGSDGIRRVVWPDSMEPRIYGEIKAGTPPDGDFVKPGNAGTDYESPGYRIH